MGRISHIRNYRFHLGMSLLSRIFRWVAVAIGVMAVFGDFYFNLHFRRSPDHELLALGGIEFVCASGLRAMEPKLLRGYR